MRWHPSIKAFLNVSIIERLNNLRLIDIQKFWYFWEKIGDEVGRKEQKILIFSITLYKCGKVYKVFDLTVEPGKVEILA